MKCRCKVTICILGLLGFLSVMRGCQTGKPKLKKKDVFPSLL